MCKSVGGTQRVLWARPGLSGTHAAGCVAGRHHPLAPAMARRQGASHTPHAGQAKVHLPYHPMHAVAFLILREPLQLQPASAHSLAHQQRRLRGT